MDRHLGQIALVVTRRIRLRIRVKLISSSSLDLLPSLFLRLICTLPLSIAKKKELLYAACLARQPSLTLLDLGSHLFLLRLQRFKIIFKPDLNDSSLLNHFINISESFRMEYSETLISIQSLRKIQMRGRHMVD